MLYSARCECKRRALAFLVHRFQRDYVCARRTPLALAAGHKPVAGDKPCHRAAVSVVVVGVLLALEKVLETYDAYHWRNQIKVLAYARIDNRHSHALAERARSLGADC